MQGLPFHSPVHNTLYSMRVYVCTNNIMHLLSYVYSGTLLEQTPPGSKTSSKVSLAQGVVVDHTPLKIVAKTMDDETVCVDKKFINFSS